MGPKTSPPPSVPPSLQHRDSGQPSADAAVPSKKERPPRKKSEATVFIEWFAAEWEKIFEKPYMIVWGKDSKIVNDMLKLTGAGSLRSMATVFLRSTDQYLEDNGKTIGLLKASFNKYTAMAHQEEAKPDPRRRPVAEVMEANRLDLIEDQRKLEEAAKAKDGDA